MSQEKSAPPDPPVVSLTAKPLTADEWQLVADAAEGTVLGMKALAHKALAKADPPVVPAIDQRCICCPVEVRGLFAVAFNLLNLRKDPERWQRKISERLDELQSAVNALEPFIEAHFANRDHASLEHNLLPISLPGAAPVVGLAPPSPLRLAIMDWYELVTEHSENPNFDVLRLVDAGGAVAQLALDGLARPPQDAATSRTSSGDPA